MESMKRLIAALIATTAIAAAQPVLAQPATTQRPALQPASGDATMSAAALVPDAQGRLVLPKTAKPLHYDILVRPDAKTLSFTGSVAIDIEIASKTRTLVLNAADIGFDRVRLAGRPEAPQITLDPERQTAAFTFATPIAPGRYALHIDYHGKIYQQASGLFALDYDGPSKDGKTAKQRALFTQFEPTDARRFVPSFDEPADKATFTVSAVVRDDQMALSNMPIVSRTPLGGGLERVSFAQTPKMSSYLLFFGLGDFERIHRLVDGVDVGVVVKRGDTAQAAYALDAAAHILPYYNNYFGTKFPLPKLDLIGGPGSSQFFGAMENWGAIFYFEQDLLVDPRIATESDRQRVYIVVAHEMAHQWFGDLVTMAWWDDLWLNEGFASWMENKVTDHFHPEWRVWLQQLESKQYAMGTDAKAGTHPIIQPIHDILQAQGAFDEITYDKGASVIRMLESYTGEDAWRDGVRRYIAAHAYSNAVTDDLWREIDAGNPRKITDIAHDFTLQAGVPMIEVHPSSCGDRVEGALDLSQHRFGLDAEDKTPRRWAVPVTVQGLEVAKTAVIDGAPVSVPTNCPSVVNAGQTGYFRTLYEAQAFSGIQSRYGSLEPYDQLGILNDTSSEAFAGYAPMAQFLDIAARLPADANPVVDEALVGQLGGLDRLYDGLPGQARFRTFAIEKLQPILSRVGWESKPGEAPNTESLRSAVLATLGRLGDPQVIAEAKTRFQALVGGAMLQPTEREAVLSIIASAADPAIWDQIHTLARDAKTDLEKREYYDLLGSARDEALAKRALALALSGEPAPTTAPGIISSVSRRHPALALEFVDTNWAKVAPLLDSAARGEYAPRLVAGGADPALIAALNRFGDAHLTANARGEFKKAEASITYNAEIRSQRLPEVDRWLAAHGG
jgi:aminopeptidase N